MKRIDAAMRAEIVLRNPRIPLIEAQRLLTRRDRQAALAEGLVFEPEAESGLRLAERRGRLFLHEGAVMDGMPLFNAVERCLPGARVLGFRGLVNSTTTRILSRMEEGVPFDDALREAQAAGVAEADPRHDLEGWDAAVKACALANALMGADVRPAQVERLQLLAGERPDHLDEPASSHRSDSSSGSPHARRDRNPSASRMLVFPVSGGPMKTFTLRQGNSNDLIDLKRRIASEVSMPDGHLTAASRAAGVTPA